MLRYDIACDGCLATCLDLQVTLWLPSQGLGSCRKDQLCTKTGFYKHWAQGLGQQKLQDPSWSASVCWLLVKFSH